MQPIHTFRHLRSAVLCLALASVVAAADKPNVLFIAVDDLRPEMGCYGNAVVKTPNIDRLAARGIVFNHAYCQQAVCSPTRSSLLTGRRPDATRVWDLETHFRVALPDVVTLPQYFKANGYHCAALNKIYHHGFEDGRSWSEPHWYPNGQTIDTDPADWSKRIIQKVGPGVQERAKAPLPADNDKPNTGKPGKASKGPAFEVSSKADDELPDGFTAAEAVERLHDLKAKGKPFFLAVGFLKPHLPFIAPKKYWDLYDPNKIAGPAIDHLPDGAPAFAGHDNGELHSYANVPKGNPIPADFARTLRHGYYACISYTDAQVGRLLDALQKEGLADNTVVVLWGDHGWQLGDHGLWHKHTNFELATRAPLILSLPQQRTAGQKCDAPVEFVDVYPTLADVCGLPVPTGLDGVSLKPLVEDPTKVATKVAISQYPRGGGQTGGKSLMGYSIRDSRWRLTLWRDRNDGGIAATELYDEQNDPAESKNLAPANPDVVKRLSASLPPLIKPAPAKPNTTRADPGGGDRAALFEKRDKNRDGKLSREESLVYKKVGERELKLFIEKPPAWKASDARPAMVFFFGGGWVGGSPEQFLKQSEYLATRGMVGIRVEYRTIPKGDKGPPVVCCADAKSAVRYVRAHAAELGIDPRRIAASGGSAGGHLAAFTALVDGLDDPQDDLKVCCKPEALVLFNPVFNNAPGQWGHERVGGRFKEFSPAHHVTKDAPPCVVFLGDQDKLIPVSVLRDFEAAMKAAGVRCDAHIYPSAGHGFFNRDPNFSATLLETDKFLASLGWLQGPPTLKPPAAGRDGG